MRNLGSSGDTKGTPMTTENPQCCKGRSKGKGKDNKEVNLWSYYHKQCVHMRLYQHHSQYYNVGGEVGGEGHQELCACMLTLN